MSLRRITTQSRVDEVVESLAAYVSEVGLGVGERLPAERELVARLGVSRSVLREALRHLTVLGVVEARTGSGTYLKRPTSPNDRHIVVNVETERESLIQLLEFRRALESEAAGLAALRATEEEVGELEALVNALEDEFHIRGDNPESDKAFHLALYRYADNPLLHQLFESLWDLLERFWRKPLGKEDFAKRTLPLHRVIVERIRARDAEGARRAVRDLLAIVEEDLRG